MIKIFFDNYKGFIKAGIVLLVLVIGFALGAGFQETRLTNYVYASCSPDGITRNDKTETCQEDTCGASQCDVQICPYTETCVEGEWAQTGTEDCYTDSCRDPCTCAGGGGGGGSDYQTVKTHVVNCETRAPIEDVLMVIIDKEDGQTFLQKTDEDGETRLKWEIDDDHTYDVYPYGNAVSPNQSPPNYSRGGLSDNTTSSYNTVTEEMTPLNSDAYKNQGAGRDDDCAKACDFCFRPLHVGGRIVDKNSNGVGDVPVVIWTNADEDNRKTYDLVTNADGWFQMGKQIECSDSAGWEFHVVPIELVDTTNSVAWNYNIDENQPLGSDHYLFQDCTGTRNKHCAYSGPNLGCTFVTAPGPIGEITKITIERGADTITISPIPVDGEVTFLVDDEVNIFSTAVAQDSDIVVTGQYRRDYIPDDDWVGDCDPDFGGNWCREAYKDTCSGQTCKLKNTWTVTDDDLGHWWYVMNAFDEEGNDGKEKGRCSGNPINAITPNPPAAGWSDCGDRSRIRIHVVNPPTGTITADTEETDSDGVVTAGGDTLRVLQNTTVWFTGTGTAYDGNSVDHVSFRKCTDPILNTQCKSAATSDSLSPSSGCDSSPCTLSHEFTVVGKYRVNLNVRDDDVPKQWCYGYKNKLSVPKPWCDRPDHTADHVWVEVIPVHKISGNLGEIADAAACTGPINNTTFIKVNLTIDPIVKWTPDILLDPLFPVRFAAASPTEYVMTSIGESDGWIKSTTPIKSTLGGKWKLACVDINSDGTWASYTGPTGNAMTLNKDRIVDFGYEYVTNPPWFVGLNGDIYGKSINVFVGDLTVNWPTKLGYYSSSLFKVILFTETLNINDASNRITHANQFIRNYTGNFWPEVLDLTPPDTVSTLTDISNIDPNNVYKVTAANLNTMLSGGVYDLTEAGVAVVYVTGGATVKFDTTFLSDASDERILFVMRSPVTIASSIGFDAHPFETSPTDDAHIEAAILTSGSITYKASVPDVPILVEGPLISGNGDLAGTPNINFSRDLKGANDFRPAVAVRYNPQILDIKQNSGLLISDVLWVVEDVELIPFN